MHTTTPSTTIGSGSADGACRRSLARRATSALTVLAAVSAVALSLTPAPALADDCPNAALRAQNNSTQLPDCRAYEVVSPQFKEGFATAPTGFTDDGRLSYLSNGNYANNGNGSGGYPAGNAYLATRTGSSWSTTALTPSGPDFVPISTGEPFLPGASKPLAYSSDLRSTLWNMRRSDQPRGVQDLYVRDPDDVFDRIGSAPDQPGKEESGGETTTVLASDDLSHVVFGTKTRETYEFVRTDGDQRRAVSVDNGGQSLVSGSRCASTGVSGYHGISVDGRVIFLTCSASSAAVYARVGGTVTIAVSGSQCTRAPSDPGGACGAPAPAGFQGANADGTRVYFTTSQQLVNGDTDSATDLYECDIPTGTLAPVGTFNPCPDLRQVSDDANVQGPTRISDDGSRAYFVATGVLASNLDANGAPAVAGNNNLYVWTRDAAHPDGETRFVAKLDPADGGMAGMRQTTDDGRYLVFATYAPLIDHGPQADTDTASDVYRYDAETGALRRLSTDAEGEGGNQPGADAGFIPIGYVPGLNNRPAPRGAMSDDGRSVVFSTDETLAPSDANGTVDVYLWRDGRVSLISSGKPSEDHNFSAGGAPFGSGLVPPVQGLISPSGRDVFFTTTVPLVPSDVDTVMDIYDARIGGGFDQSTLPRCSGDACQGPLAPPPPASKPGSTSPTGPDGSPQVTPAFSVKALTASQLRRVESTGKVSLSVTTNAPGSLSAKATATIAKRSSTVGSAKRTVTKPGSLSLSLTLSKKVQAELKRKRKLTVKVLVGQDNVAIARTVSLKLTQPKTTKKRSARTTSRDAAAKGGRS
jgi:hypothetical protein